MPSPDGLYTFDASSSLEQVTRLLAQRLQEMDPNLDGWREARLVVAYGCEMELLELLCASKRLLSEFPLATQRRLHTAFLRRLSGEPLSRIRGKRAFWKSVFSVSPHTLDPRPETEGLIELAGRFFAGREAPRTVVDAGTGTACLLLSLLQEFPEASGVGIDCSKEALEVARGNATQLGLTDRCVFVHNNWLGDMEGPFDLIVSNPPYIPSGVLPRLSPSVRDFDPALALDGGSDGLEAFRCLVPQAATLLSPRGVFLMEFGIHQERDLEILLRDFFPHVTFFQDLAGLPRYVQASFEGGR